MSIYKRLGITPPKRVIQLSSMDEALRNGLWNNLYLFYFDKFRGTFAIGELINSNDKQYSEAIALDRLVKSLWIDFFKKPYDNIRHNDWIKIRSIIRSIFFEYEWHDVYIFLEYIVNTYQHKCDITRNDECVKACNATLNQELSAYRFVGYKIAPITSEEEISSIEKALEDTTQLKGVNIHLKTALDLFADRKAPDYRNSIKESISAVEAICGLIAGKTHISLGDALKEIERKSKIQIHAALRKSFEI
jgi:hypothetical protein